MARTGKPLQPLDRSIARILTKEVERAGISQRGLAGITGMSQNRIGIILRGDEPPSTVGEVALLAAAVGRGASSVIHQAENDISGQPDDDRVPLAPVAPAPTAAPAEGTSTQGGPSVVPAGRRAKRRSRTGS